MDKETKDLIVLDYEKSLAFIDKMDDRIFTIRKWTITSITAIIALAFTVENKYVLLGNISLILGFYTMELFYKGLRENIIGKRSRLEKLLQPFQDENELLDNYTFGMEHLREIPGLKEYWIIARDRWHSTLFYIGLTIITMTFWVLLSVNLVGAFHA